MFNFVSKFCVFALDCFRASNRLRRVSNRFLIRNVVCPRAFMSSRTATEALYESKGSKEYGSEQIQVNHWPWLTIKTWLPYLDPYLLFKL